MRVSFMVLEAVDDSQESLEVKTANEYLTIADVSEIKFHNEYFGDDDNQIIEIVTAASNRYFLPVLPETMAYFINLSHGISFDWSGYYAIRIFPRNGRINKAEVDMAMKMNAETWKWHEEEVNNEADD